MPEEDRWRMWQRNVLDKYKDVPTEDIKKELQEKSYPAAILMSQIQGDFNIASVIRSANNFNLSRVYYFGNKRYDRRGTCGTYHYTDVIHLPSISDIIKLKSSYKFVALENNIEERKVSPIKDYVWDKRSMIVVGEENAGIPKEVLDICDDFIDIPSMGSVRSLNAAVAASIAMYDYVNKTSR